MSTEEISDKTFKPSQEPSDHLVYSPWMSFNKDTFEFYFAAVKFYESLLETDFKAVQNDQDLKAILGEEELDSYPIGKELKRVKRFVIWFANHIEKAGKHAETWGYEVELTHGVVRFIKSVSLLYLAHLRGKRQKIASRPTTSKVLLEAVDQQLARLEEKTQLGVFRIATPYPLIIDQLSQGVDQALPQDRVLVRDLRPRPVILDTIEIRDPALRNRCLDLFAQFREDGQHDRLDTVVNEATRILEDRLRSLSNAPPNCVGVDLAKEAFALPNPRLIVSDIAAEQDSAHLLYRGVFGFVRNSAHHRLLGTLQPERVLQVVGMVDYLISVAEAAQREKLSA